MNIVILIGRLTRDPKEITSGVRFTLAIDRPQAEDGTKSADFPTVTVFGRQAESCKRYLAKGRQVAVQGALSTGSYTDKNGNTVYTTEVIARRVQFLDYIREQSEQPRPQPQPNDFEAIQEDIPF